MVFCLIICLSGLFLLSGCKKDEPDKFPSITTKPVIPSLTDYAESGGIIGEDGNVEVTERGVIWGTDPNLLFTTADGITKDGKGSGEFKSTMVFLDLNTTYFVRAYANTMQKYLYGDIQEFVLSRGASVITGNASSVKGKSAILSGYVTPNNSPTIVSFQLGTGADYFLTIPFSNSPVDGYSTYKASFQLEDLQPNTTYHFRIKGDNSAGTTYGRDTSFTTKDVIKDIDFNTYSVVKIGNQTWFMDNLKATHYSTGDPISTSLTAGNYGSVWSYNNDPLQIPYYGRLYNYYASVDSRNICPTGWHVPTVTEFNTLQTFLGGAGKGGKLKENGPFYWSTPNTGATNESEFSAMPGGYRTSEGSYSGIKNYSYFLSLSDNLTGNQNFALSLSYNSEAITISKPTDKSGFSVRCIKGTIPVVFTGDAKNITGNSAVIAGIINPNNEPSTVTFDYGLTTSYGQSITLDGQIFSGNSPVTAEAHLYGLKGGMQYHFRIKASTQYGTAAGLDSTFITKARPVVITSSAVVISPGKVKLRGKVLANGSPATVSFLFGESTEYGQILMPENNTASGDAPEAFDIVVADLPPGKTYHFKIVAINELGESVGSDSQFSTDMLQDIDGNYYSIIKIRDNYWMQNNLATTHFSNGDLIPEIQDLNKFITTRKEAYSNYNNSAELGLEYGRLYNEFVAEDPRNICPVGWYVPRPDLWIDLTTYFKESELRETGISHWLTTNSGVTNLTGFSALPGGYRTTSNFKAVGIGGFWWCLGSVDADLTRENYAYIDTVGEVLNIASGKLNYGFSIRCVKGNLPVVKTGSVTGLTGNSVTLSGTVNANALTTSVYFTYTSSTGISVTVPATPATVEGSDAIKVSVTLTGLSPVTRYNYKITATNKEGTVLGRELQFITLSSK